MQDGLLVHCADIFLEHVASEQALDFGARNVICQLMPVGHHAPLNLPDGLCVGLHNGLEFFLEGRRDEFVGVQEKNVIALRMCNETIALNGKALPVGIVVHFGAGLQGQTGQSLANLYGTGAANLASLYGTGATNLANLYGQTGGQLAGAYGQTGAGLSDVYGQTGAGLASLFGQGGAQRAGAYGQTGANLANAYGQTGANLSDLFTNVSNTRAGLYGQTGANLANLYSATGANQANMQAQNAVRSRVRGKHIVKTSSLAECLPGVRARLEEMGGEARGSTPEEMKTLVASQTQKWIQVVNEAKIPKQ